MDTQTPDTPGQEESRQLQQALQHHRAGRLAEAEALYRQILEKQPGHADALHLSGLVAHQRGQNESAARLIGKAIEANPGNPLYHSNLGLALRAQGKLDEAIRSYREALAISPGNIEILGSMAGILLKQGKLDEAISCLRRVLAARPGSAQSHNNLGILLGRQGKLDEAVASFKRALSLKPDYAEAHNNLGTTYRELGRESEAIACYRSAISIRPDYIDALCGLGIQLQAQGDYAGAVENYRCVLAARPGDIDVLYNLGYSLRNLGRLGEAVTALTQALSIKPDLADAHVNLAAIYTDLGRFHEAQTSMARALEIDPVNHGALVMLTTSRKMTLDDAAWLETVARLSVDPTLPLKKRSDLHFALGKYYDDTNQYDHAFAAYEQANSLQRQLEGGFDRGKFTRLVDMLIMTYGPEIVNLRRAACSLSELPVLVVGMPRSGTSLVEQIIASHPQACGAGELTFWLKWFEANQTGIVSRNLEDSFIANTASEYEQYLRQYAAEALRIVDKMPSSFALLGLIHLVFPRAKFIHVRRNPVDTCLSVYFQNLSSTHSYGTDLDDLAYYYRQYDRLMRHWSKVLPSDNIMEVSYEALIDNPVEWSKRMVEFIGLEWSEQCLDFHATERRVGTSSNWQVRQKMYHSSKARWRNYEKHIGPLLGLLDIAV
jgi:tetratricopeptide (TPR) repeat protein